jgi:hypothetical protein
MGTPRISLTSHPAVLAPLVRPLQELEVVKVMVY